MQKVIVRRAQQQDQTKLDERLHPVLQRVYVARGVASLAELERGLEHLIPFNSLLNIEKAVALLVQALQEQQRIIVIGDFDADGATSSALAVSALCALGAKQVRHLVPNRFEFGYGLTPEIVQVAAEWQPQLLITVDNGISSMAGVAAAKAFGMRVLITDHHLAGLELPDADAIVNPNQPNDFFPSKNLAGVGVIFYVMLALRHQLRQIDWFVQQSIPEPNMAQFLDLVALGTVADVVPLDKNNRILVYQGLQRIRAGKCRPGILALLEVAKRDFQRLIAADLGFAVGPRLNAAGRLDDMSLGIACLLSADLSAARIIAQQLDGLNLERREIEQDMHQQAIVALKKVNAETAGEMPFGICLFDESWHQGVIGILASRIKDKQHRPVIIFAAASNTELKGSARSIAGLHIRDVLQNIASRYPELITRFGGHAMAAGLSLLRENYAAFCQAFDEEVRRQITEEHLRGEIYSDGELAQDDFTLPLAEQLRAAGPWGQAFPEPLFDGCFKLLDRYVIGGKHLKMRLAPLDSKVELEAIAFNMNIDAWLTQRIEYINAAYRLEINEFRGQKNLQLILEHVEPL